MGLNCILVRRFEQKTGQQFDFRRDGAPRRSRIEQKTGQQFDFRRDGAPGQNRTDTPLRERDFETTCTLYFQWVRQFCNQIVNFQVFCKRRFVIPIYGISSSSIGGGNGPVQKIHQTKLRLPTHLILGENQLQ